MRFLLANLEEPERYSWWLGFAIEPGRKLPAFDTVLLQLGRGLFPFSALIPFAAARASCSGAPTAEAWTSSAASRCPRWFLVRPVVACAGYTLLSRRSPACSPGAVAALAVIPARPAGSISIAARRGSRVFGMVVGALALVLLFDFDAFGEGDVRVRRARPAAPETFRGTSTLLLAAGTLAFAAITFVAVLEEPTRRCPSSSGASSRPGS